MSKPGTGQKLGQLQQSGSQVENAKEKFLKELESSAVNAQMRKKSKTVSVSADVEEVSGVWMECPSSHSVPVNQSLLEQGSDTHQFKAERGEETLEEMLEVRRGWFMMFKKKSCLCNRSVR